ncbi:unnamed protein product [Chrysoparadoxa australica]
MSREKIRVSLQAFDYQILDQTCKNLLEIVLRNEPPENIKGPIPLPTRRRIYCVLRSPHVDKDAREQFEIRRYKRIIDLYPEKMETIDLFLKMELSAGLSINVKVYKQEEE